MNQHYPFSLQPLPYGYDALEPQISAETLHFHHDKHLQTYVDNLNKALENAPDLHNCSLEELLTCLDKIPEKIRTAVRNNAGGVYNHQLYFDAMGPAKDEKPCGALGEAIQSTFGSYDEWKKQMREAALAQFGSGWAWLVFDQKCGLHIVKTPNQDTPLCSAKPILLVDVWEHAYYLQYQNRRAEYIDNWFSIIDWKKADSRYACG